MLTSLYNTYLKHPHIAIDSRKVIKGSIFFALKGKSVDGHNFITEAIDKGAAGVVIDQPTYKKNDHYFLVKNVLQTLQQLALHHRKQYDIPVIGITGSNGKTTAKELIHQVLSEKYTTTATQGNLNNHIGVPLTLLRITTQTDIAIIEMGANRIGDITQLCQIAQPTHGLITNINAVHLEGFKSWEGVLRGKSELYHHLLQSKGTVFINSQEEVLKSMAKRFPNPYFYPQTKDFFHARLVSAKPYVAYVADDHTGVINTNLIGKHSFHSIAAALCIGKYFKIPPSKAHTAIQNYQPGNNRLQIIKKKSNTIIMDAYNANPVSLKAALEVVYTWHMPQKILILGDMAELGDMSTEIHKNILQKIRKNLITYEEVLLVGDHFMPSSCKEKKIKHFQSKLSLQCYLQKKNFHETLFLVKGSRKWALEDLLEVL